MYEPFKMGTPAPRDAGASGARCPARSPLSTEVSLLRDVRRYPALAPQTRLIEAADWPFLEVELANAGNVSAHLHNPAFKGRQRLAAAHQLLAALAHLHAHAVVHCDVKLENVALH